MKLKQTFKKIMAATLTAAMTMSMASITFAAPAGATAKPVVNEIKDVTDTITIKAASDQSLEGKEFDVYRIFNLRTSGSGAETKYEYFQVDQKITNAAYDIIKTIDATNYTYGPDKKPNTADDINYYLSDGVTVNYQSVVKWFECQDSTKEGDKSLSPLIRKFADSFRAALTDSGNVDMAKAAYATTIKNIKAPYSIATSEPLSLGYYIVLESKAGTNGAASLAMLNTVKPFEMTVKSDVPSVEKKIIKGDEQIKADDYEIGGKVTFQLIGRVPDFDGYTNYEYAFVDTLSDGLKYNNDAKLFLANEDPTGKIVKNGDAIATTDEDDTDSLTTSVSGQTITFKIGKSASVKGVPIKDIKAETRILKDSYIIVEYTATVNANAEMGKPGNDNKVKIEFSNSPYDTGKGFTPEDKVVVYSYELDVFKTNGTVKLDGAHFKLYRDTNCKNVVTVTGDNGKYVVDPNKSTSDMIVNDGKDLSSDKGKLIIKGLDEGTYYLKETIAPTGYNVLQDPIEIKIDSVFGDGTVAKPGYTSVGTYNELSSLKINGTAGDLETGIVELTVLNKAGSLLPSTGGVGTTILYVLGILAMAGGVFYFVMSKRSKANK